ncbi:OmpP1/FadL family transporter [Nitratireductor luteus]|uniref:OmpP1/FadL family transporter n=1 Tax=Nitratireductor luteus TaxID=2976980 RepID=UPI00223EC423|nr:OmpP1/FadL family transporter [Nitratireductor luteus]
MRFGGFGVSALGFVLLAGSAHAGGLERGGYSVDLLYSPERFVGEASGTYVMPGRKLNNVVDSNPLNGTPSGSSQGVRDTESYFVPRIGFKAGLTDSIDCMVDYSQPWGVHTNPGLNWAGANSNIETKFNSDNFAGTCSYKFQAGKGQFRVIGGGFYQKLDAFKERLVFDFTGTPASALYSGIGRLDLEGDGWGWRVGAAYEIPEIAFRASLMYNSRVELNDVTGTLDLTNLPAGFGGNPLTGASTPVFGSAAMPESVELKLQSGIAPNWLAFGSVKWVNWSILQSIAFCPESTRGVACVAGGPTQATKIDLLYRDGWTVSGGVGHKFNDQWSGAASLTWDRGTSHGYGHQADSWTLGAGVGYTPNSNVEVRLGGAIGLLTSGESDGSLVGDGVNYDFGTDVVGALNGSLKVKW